MIILHSNNFIQGAYSIREIYIQMCNIELINLQKNKSLGLNQVLQKYSLDDIKRAINNIDVDKDGNIVTPEHTNTDRLLRLLEFGGEGVKPTHILSISKSKIIRTLDTRR